MRSLPQVHAPLEAVIAFVLFVTTAVRHCGLEGDNRNITQQLAMLHVRADAAGLYGRNRKSFHQVCIIQVVKQFLQQSLLTTIGGVGLIQTKHLNVDHRSNQQ